MKQERIVLAEKKDCTGCSACSAACPNSCIRFSADVEGFYYPEIDHETCVHCGKCVSVCPALAPVRRSERTLPKTFAAYANNTAIRASSSSGGIFRVLAEEILMKGGAVAGAAFTENLSVEHILVKTKEELFRLQGSKYVQSTPNQVFLEIQKLLNEQIPVLYSGTPCEVNGLLSFLGKAYENLITVDLICHGVPSDLAWKRYLEYEEAQHKSEAINASFRDKTEGWRNFSLSIGFASGEYHCKNLKTDLFLTSFLKNYCLRLSCYRCAVKGIPRRSDLTLGDFWGIDTVLPEWDDDLGVSAVFVQSESGRQLLERVKDRLTLCPVDPEEAVAHNSAMLRSVSQSPYREQFFRQLGHCSFDQLISRLIKKEDHQRCFRKLLRKAKARLRTLSRREFCQ